MTDGEFLDFLRTFNAEIRDRALGSTDQGDADFKENVFTEIVTDFLAEHGVVDMVDLCFHEGRVGRGIGKVNGYALNEDGDHLDVFATLFLDADAPQAAQKDAITTTCQRAARFIEGSLNGLHKDLEAASDIHAMARRIFEGRDSLQRIRVHVLTDGIATTRSFDPVEVHGIPIQFDVWDSERLFRGMQAGLPRDEIVIDFEDYLGSPLPCLPMPQRTSEYMAYLAILPGPLLYRLYDEYGPRLLEFNVRSFLQARGKVNRGIRDSLRAEPTRFLAYNNGIVVTVDGLEAVVPDSGQLSIRSVRGMQIVNGGQTTASIHRARKRDGVDISSVFIPAKIILVNSDHLEEVVRHVSLYANTQNVIQMADFSANDPFHVRIEHLSERIWCPGEQGRWFYERARGQYQVAQNRIGTTPARSRRFREQTPPARKFTKTDLAKFLSSWDQLPHVVSRGAQKSFSLFMQDLAQRGRDWEPDEDWYRKLIAKAILFKTAERVVRQERFPAYRANIVTYLVAYLSFRAGTNLDFAQVWASQAVSHGLEELLRAWSHEISAAIVETSQGRNVTEWAKKEDCWKAVRSRDLPIPTELPVELRTGMTQAGLRYGPGEELSPRDYENIARCKQVDGGTWLKIYAWGTQTGLLEKWQCGIAQTLSAYAAAGWERSPSPKQAKHGLAILDAARKGNAV